ncbi:hypothetical protein [Camelimonas lactis]|uniref:Uncharacterized protein n=1 Tax=Camelimonas lactis TaxID=659006 RepID=A0A4R2GXK6_9HYPH|nr:hypothetical protein [Camelimonas lactis]TCO15225.1 hypothetical protein EV666_102203 [Camelimonas lactis]
MTDVNDNDSGVLARLRRHKEATTGDHSFTLPNTGVVVTYPQFRGYEDWSRAQRMAGDDPTLINLYYIITVCAFDGEKLRAGDYRELIPSDDHLALSGRMFGGKVADTGNDRKA